MKKKKEYPIRKSWYNMIERCTNENHFAYKNYGAKGVSVCEEWLNSFGEFKKWALANGWRKGLQLDKDIIGDGKLYSPKTCCFVDLATNSRNRVKSKKYKYGSGEFIISEISKIAGVSLDKLRHRINKLGMSADDAVSDILEGKKYKRTKMPTDLKDKLLNATRKRVIDLSSGIEFISIRAAANYLLISEQCLGAMLNGKKPNKTNMAYLKSLHFIA